MSKYISTAFGEPEFINITSINPFISKCDIKVFYLGQNRNKTSISKESAIKIAQSLPGCPIVGDYSYTDKDFQGHGQHFLMEEDHTMKIVDSLVPYGFIDLHPKVWFQNFREPDGQTGEMVNRTYLMTQGYLWPKQMPECQKVIKERNGQSVEFDDYSFKTKKHKDGKTCIIVDGNLKNLCILGHDVKPAFETAGFYPISSLTSYSHNTVITRLQDMASELKYTLEQTQGGIKGMDQTMDTEVTVDNSELSTINEVVENETPLTIQDTTPSATEILDDPETIIVTEDSEITVQEPEENTQESEVIEEEPDNSLAETIAQMQAQYDELQNRFNELAQFKADYDNTQKDALINSFDTLTDAEKADIVNNKSTLTLDEIESKLCVLEHRKNVNKPQVKRVEEQDEPASQMTYSLTNNTQTSSDLPSFLRNIRENF